MIADMDCGIISGAPALHRSRPAGAVAVVVAMCLGLLVSMFNSTLVNVMLPDIGGELHASATELEWVNSIYTLTYGALLLLGGALGNRVGRRTTFLWGTAVFTIGSLGCLFAPGMVVLLATRVVQAIGVAIMLPQTLSILVYEFEDPADLARAVGAWAGISSLGLCAGPVIGGVIVSSASWRVGFGLSVVLGLLTLALGIWQIPSQRHGRPASAPSIDYAGCVLGAVSLAALVYGLVESDALGWASPWIGGAFVLAVLALAGFLAVEVLRPRHGRVPLMPLGLWRSGQLIAANLAGLTYFFMFFGLLFFYSIDLQQSRGYTPLQTGLLLLPMTILMAVAGPIAGRLAARWGSARVLVLGLVVGVLGTLLLSLQDSGADVTDLEWRLAIVGIGSGLMSSSMSNLAVTAVDAQHSTTASALHNTCRQIGATLGVAVLGIIVSTPPTDHHPTGATTPGLDNAMALTAAILAVSALAIAILSATAHGPTKVAAR